MQEALQIEGFTRVMVGWFQREDFLNSGVKKKSDLPFRPLGESSEVCPGDSGAPHRHPREDAGVPRGMLRPSAAEGRRFAASRRIFVFFLGGWCERGILHCTWLVFFFGFFWF